MKAFRALTCCLVAMAVSGCGVIFGGSSEVVRITTTPSPAQITAEPAIATASSPASLELPRKNSYVITASADGYEPAELAVTQNMRTGILVLDILFTGLIGVVVDAVTGGWWDLEPNNATLVLERIEGAMIDGPEKVHVSVRLVDGDDAKVLSATADHPGVTLEIVKAR